MGKRACNDCGYDNNPSKKKEKKISSLHQEGELGDINGRRKKRKVGAQAQKKYF